MGLHVVAAPNPRLADLRDNPNSVSVPDERGRSESDPDNPGAGTRLEIVSLASGRSWMVPPCLPSTSGSTRPYATTPHATHRTRENELLMCHRECSGSFRGACFGGVLFSRWR